MSSPLSRRLFVASASAALVSAQERVTQPAVSEEACPLEVVAPAALDGYLGQAVLRKPPGPGPFPAILWIHGGLTKIPVTALQNIARTGPNPLRFLAAGYVVIVPTYRSRDVDPQSRVSFEDCLGAVKHLRSLRYVDAKSIVPIGCSGGGDLALEIAAATDVCAIIAEEPASLLMAGVLNTKSPKQGDRYSPRDANPILENPKEFYTPEYQKLLRAKISRIQRPILIIQGDDERRGPSVNHFNEQVLVPELRGAGKSLEVKTYPGEQHCFCMIGRESRPGNVLKAFRDMDGFCRRHIATKPKPLDSGLVKQVEL